MLKQLSSALSRVRAFGVGMGIQAILSGGSFVVGLILLRRTDDLQYGYYILAYNALLFVNAVQASIVQPYIVAGINSRDLAGRRDLVGGVLKGSRRLVPVLVAIASAIVAGIWLAGWIGPTHVLIIGATIFAAAMSLSRDGLRLVLFGYRQPTAILRADVVYSSVLIGGVYLATLSIQPAVAAVLAMGAASLLGAVMLNRALWGYEAWNPHAHAPHPRAILELGTWSFVGAAIHWLLIQGYSYLAASLGDVHEVAELAGTRLTLMPIYVMSGGVSMLLLPMTSRWIRDGNAATALKYLLRLVAALVGGALFYVAFLWIFRDWIFAELLKKQFQHRDTLIVLWSAVFLVTLCRDQLATLPAARGQFRKMAVLTAVSSVVWALGSYLAMNRMGSIGAVAGVLIGESFNLLGIVVLAAREVRLNNTNSIARA